MSFIFGGGFSVVDEEAGFSAQPTRVIHEIPTRTYIVQEPIETIPTQTWNEKTYNQLCWLIILCGMIIALTYIVFRRKK